MTVDQVKQIIVKQGWTPQEKPRRGKGKLYLYAARRSGSRLEWRYIAPVSRIENLTEQDVLDRLALTTK
jgi:hypothetical protein